MRMGNVRSDKNQSHSSYKRNEKDRLKNARQVVQPMCTSVIWRVEYVLLALFVKKKAFLYHFLTDSKQKRGLKDQIAISCCFVNMDKLVEIAGLNECDYDPNDIKVLSVGIEPWLRKSPLLQSYQTLCAYDKTHIRLWLPAQCIKEGPEAFESTHLKNGILAVPNDNNNDNWFKGALKVECNIICNKTPNAADFASLQLVRFAVRVYPQCAQCSKIFDTASVSLTICSGCKIPFYCNKECQELDWPIHKPKCEFIQKTGAAAAIRK
jgi:MYND finger